LSISVYESRADDGRASCPICDWALDAADGYRGPFLSCPNPDCSYTRNLDAPPPRNGMIVCSNCCGAAVEYHETEKRGAQWRCTTNNGTGSGSRGPISSCHAWSSCSHARSCAPVCNNLNLDHDGAGRRPP
jgi:hypothetical protein